jgi:hypothetical protein
MTDAESRLRQSMHAAAPEPTEVTYLVDAAWERAARVRRRRLAGVTSAVVAVLVLAGFWLSSTGRQSSLPATTHYPGPGGSACDAPGDRASFDSFVIAGDRFSSVTLCPSDLRAPAWAGLPKQRTVADSELLRKISLVTYSRPNLLCDAAVQDPPFRLVLEEGSANTRSYVDSTSLDCYGRTALAGFFDALAVAQAGPVTSWSGPCGPDDIVGREQDGPQATDQLRPGDAITRAHLCVYGLPATGPTEPVGADDAPRYHPVVSADLPAKDLPALTAALDGQYIDPAEAPACQAPPYLVRVRLTLSSGRRDELASRCDHLYTMGIAGPPLQLPPVITALIEAAAHQAWATDTP